jgi:uncharacterized repeat protein (TIGR02543 family)
VTGVLTGPVTFDAARQAVVFPGGSNGTAYVDLAGDYADFTGGFTIEFEAEFGATRSAWERIIDFALGLDSGGATQIHNAFWIGQLASTNELTVEVWQNGVQPGYCYTATGGTALGTPGSREFARWMVTIGTVGPNAVCRIYRDGAALPTRVSPFGVFNVNPTGADTDGSTYVLPLNTSRPSAFVGRSNFTADRDLEGAIRYIRIYNRELTATQAATNASRTLTFDANDGSARTSTQASATEAALTAVMFTRAGHTFLGWDTEADGTGEDYADGASYSFAADLTLFAQWRDDRPPVEPDGSESTPAGPELALACEGVAANAGTLVTCTVSGADPHLDIVWRMGDEDGDGPAGALRTDELGDATFLFTAPRRADGVELVVHLVGWGVSATVGGPSVGAVRVTPTAVRAGEGPMPLVPLTLVLIAALMTIVVNAVQREREFAAVAADQEQRRHELGTTHRHRLPGFDHLHGRLRADRSALRDQG